MPGQLHRIIPALGAAVVASSLVAQAPAAIPADRPIGAEHRAWVVFKDGGRVVSVGEWRIKPPLLIFHGDTGALLSARLDSLDFEATRRLNGIPPPLPTAAVELQFKEHKLTPQEEREIRLEAQADVFIENSLTPKQRAERDKRRVVFERGGKKMFEEFNCILNGKSSLGTEICRLRVEIAYRPQF